jgi:hypothetical protein
VRVERVQVTLSAPKQTFWHPLTPLSTARGSDLRADAATQPLPGQPQVGDEDLRYARPPPGRADAAALADTEIAYAQVNGPNTDGLGVMASSQDALADCRGGYVYASLHTGATAWYILAYKGIDPCPERPSPPSGAEPHRRRRVRAYPRRAQRRAVAAAQGRSTRRRGTLGP